MTSSALAISGYMITAQFGLRLCESFAFTPHLDAASSFLLVSILVPVAEGLQLHQTELELDSASCFALREIRR